MVVVVGPFAGKIIPGATTLHLYLSAGLNSYGARGATGGVKFRVCPEGALISALML